MSNLSQNSAYSRSLVMYLSGTKTPGVSASVSVYLSKAGGSFALAVGSVTEIGSGWYSLALAPADTDTLGDLAYNCTAMGCDPNDFCDQVGPTPANVVQINGDATDGNNATLSLKQLNIVNTGGDAILAHCSSGDGHGIHAVGGGVKNGIAAHGGDTGVGISALGGSTSGPGMFVRATGNDSHGMYVIGTGAGHGVFTQSDGSGNGVLALGGGDSAGISAQGGPTGPGLTCVGGGTSGDGIYAVAVGVGVGIKATP